MEKRREVLVLDQAVLQSGWSGWRDLIMADMTLHPSELAMIHVEHLQRASSFADVCSGLTLPAAGRVAFLNQDWAQLQAAMANALRGQIGRVFSGGCWLPHLSLLDNVVLRLAHHTRQRFAELRDEAVQLAEQFGLPGFPAGAPGDMMPADLQRVACVRAFMGYPALILLEEPTAGVYPEMLFALIHVIRLARRGGSAVVWLPAVLAIWSDMSIPVTSRYRLAGQHLVEVYR
jgi:phospholipid/cholesterol/gamma-HCH transport system ATP-binding protein